MSSICGLKVVLFVSRCFAMANFATSPDQEKWERARADPLTSVSGMESALWRFFAAEKVRSIDKLVKVIRAPKAVVISKFHLGISLHSG